MEMGKLTAKLRDAVPVCLLVEGKEIKRYKNIEIPDDLKKLEYQDFKFDVPLNGAITFKIMFEQGVLPEEFPQARERRTRKSLAQEAQPQEAALAADATEEAEPQQEPQPAESLVQALENTQADGEPVDALAEAVADGEPAMAEAIGYEAAGREPAVMVEQESTEAAVQPESDVPAKKPAPRDKGKKGAAATDSAKK